MLATKNLHKAGSMWVSATSWEVVERNDGAEPGIIKKISF
jgi:hypothetical protein